MRADVVVGAGPAGAATAILLGLEGHVVVLLDRARFPRLDRLGVLKAVETRGGPAAPRHAVTDLVLEGPRVTDVEAIGVETGRPPERIHARLVVAADGRGSVVARRLGLVRHPPWLHRLALMSFAEFIGRLLW